MVGPWSFFSVIFLDKSAEDVTISGISVNHLDNLEINIQTAKRNPGSLSFLLYIYSVLKYITETVPERKV